MKKVILTLGLFTAISSLNAQSDFNETEVRQNAQGLINTPTADFYKSQFAGARMAYFPDENKTYIVERISTFTEEGDFAFKLINIKATVNGRLPIMLAPIITPGLNFTVERHKKRKAIKDAVGNVDHYTCAYNGGLCVILWND